MMKKISPFFLIFVMLLIFSAQAYAFEQGHYFPGVLGIRDYAVLPKGLYYVMFNPYYAAREFKDGSGDEIDHISIDGGRSVTKDIGIRGRQLTISAAGNADIDVDVQIDNILQQPSLVWSSGFKLLGAQHEALISVPFGYNRIEVTADVDAAATVAIGDKSKTISGARKLKFEEHKYGFGDMMVTPALFDWHGKHYDAVTAYTFVAPTGAYDEKDLSNVGFGFWSHWWQEILYIYPFKVPSTALMMMGTYELNSYKYDKDVRPGQTMTVEYGISQYLHERFEVGANGYHMWQISNDAGEQTFNKTVKDAVNGVGSELTLWLMKGKLALVGRFNVEYGARDRFEGYMASLNIIWAFGDGLKKQMASWAANR